jgi:ankyrin repeat protein
MVRQPRETLDEILVRASVVMFPDVPPHSISVGARDSDGDTPLHKVALWGDNYAAKVLIEAGAEIDAIGDMGLTPLHLAVMQGHELLVETLLRYGARTDIRSELSGTALDLARSSSKSSTLLRYFSQ